MTLINKEEMLSDMRLYIPDDTQRAVFETYVSLQKPVELPAHIDQIMNLMDRYLLFDLNDLVRISRCGGYHYYHDSINNTFARIMGVIGFGYFSGMISEHDFDEIYWSIVQMQRRMQQEYKQYEEEHNGEFI